MLNVDLEGNFMNSYSAVLLIVVMLLCYVVSSHGLLKFDPVLAVFSPEHFLISPVFFQFFINLNSKFRTSSLLNPVGTNWVQEVTITGDARVKGLEATIAAQVVECSHFAPDCPPSSWIPTNIVGPIAQSIAEDFYLVSLSWERHPSELLVLRLRWHLGELLDVVWCCRLVWCLTDCLCGGFIIAKPKLGTLLNQLLIIC